MEIPPQQKATSTQGFYQKGCRGTNFIARFSLGRGSKEDDMFRRTLVVWCGGVALISVACNFVLLDLMNNIAMTGGERGTMTMDLPHLLQRRNENLHSKHSFFFRHENHDIYLFFVTPFGCPIKNATQFTVQVGSRRYSLLFEPFHGCSCPVSSCLQKCHVWSLFVSSHIHPFWANGDLIVSFGMIQQNPEMSF